MPRPASRVAESNALRTQLRGLITPEQPPRPTRVGDLPTGLREGASLEDRWYERTIQVQAEAYSETRQDNAGLVVRWESSASLAQDGKAGTPRDVLYIGGAMADRFSCEGIGGNGAFFAPGGPHIIRGLATLLTELADRLDADRAAYALLAQLRGPER